MTITLPWGEQQCREVIDLLTKRAKGQIELAMLVPRGSIAEDLRPAFEARAEFLGGMAMDLMQAAVQPQEREEDDLGEGNRGLPAGGAQADSSDPAGVDA